MTDISHSDATLALGILHNAVQEFRVSVNFGEPLFEDVNGLHECINPASMITEEDVQACLLYLTATLTEGANDFFPGNIPIGRGYPHYLFAHLDLKQIWDAPKAGVDALPVFYIKGLCIKDIELVNASLANFLLTQNLNASPSSDVSLFFPRNTQTGSRENR
jgi:hypothetical protein